MRRYGGYEALSEIARGGQGVVYRGLDPSSGQPVAIKVMLQVTGNATLPKRFEREAQALARVRHPHVVQVLAGGHDDAGEPYLVLEWVEGRTLQRQLEQRGPDVVAAIGWARTLCEAVEACHAVGVLHRDLKPDNVLMAADGTLKLTDFGLARDLDPSTSRTQLTAAGKVLGSPGYWAPEQAFGQLERVGAGTDVYGVGATLFALLTGQPPHAGDTLVQILDAAQREKPLASSLNPAVPPWLDRVVARALAPDPDDRFASVEALRSALAAPSPVAPRSAGWLAGGLLLLGVTGAAAIVVSRDGASPAPPSGAEEPAPSQAPLPEASETADQAYLRGLALSQREDWGGAAEAFSEAIRLEPDQVNARVARSAARGNLDDWEGAAADAAEAIRQQPEFAKAHFTHALALEALGDTGGAMEGYGEAIRLRPDYLEAYVERAALRSDMGDWAGGAEDCTVVIRLAPTMAMGYANRGLARRKLQDFPGAIDDLDRALRLEPDLGAAYADRGLVYAKLNAYERALEDLDVAVRLLPDSVQARVNRAVVLSSLARWGPARDEYDELLRRVPDHVQALVGRGTARRELNDFPGAIEDWERALALDSQGAWVPMIRQELAALRDGVGR